MRVRYLQKGEYGDVYKVRYHQNWLAIKRNYVNREIDGVASVREIDFLSQLQHPHILQLEQLIPQEEIKLPENTYLSNHNRWKPDQLYLGTKCALRDGISLSSDRRIRIKFKLRVMAELLLGLEYMHYNQVVHRDIKLSNVLQVREGSKIVSKWCDFGSSIHYTSKVPLEKYEVGAKIYRPPEVAFGFDYEYQSDLWSFGCLVIAILTGRDDLVVETDPGNSLGHYLLSRVPKPPSEEDLKALGIKEYHRTKYNRSRIVWEHLIDPRTFEKETYSQLTDLIGRLLVPNPQKRMSATQALDHSLFQNQRPYIQETRQKYLKATISRVDQVKLPKSSYYYQQARQITSEVNEEYSPWRIAFHGCRFYQIFLEEIGSSPSDQLFYLCLHLAFKLFIDIDRMTKYQSLFLTEPDPNLTALEIEIIQKLDGKLYSRTPFENSTRTDYPELFREYLGIKKED